jgi:hypothetical protein
MAFIFDDCKKGLKLCFITYTAGPCAFTVAGCWNSLVIGRQLTVIHPGPPYRALGGQPAALPLLEVAGGEGGLGGRRRGAGGEGGAGKVGKGGALRS